MQFSVDTDRCVSCGLCLSDCLPRALGMDEAGHPYIKDERLCMHCHHCLALCPTGAISVDGHSPDASRRLLNAWPRPEQLETLIKGRRSVRQYRPENVDPALLRQVLDVSAHAPTGVNARKLWVGVMDDMDRMQAFREDVYARLADKALHNALPQCRRTAFFAAAPRLWKEQGIDGIFRGAPHFVLVGNAKDAPCQEQDPLIYLSYLELYAQSLGLGTTWCGLLYWCLQLMLPELLPELGLPETHSFQYAMLLGEPAIRYARTVEYGPATVHRIQWNKPFPACLERRGRPLRPAMTDGGMRDPFRTAAVSLSGPVAMIAAFGPSAGVDPGASFLHHLDSTAIKDYFAK